MTARYAPGPAIWVCAAGFGVRKSLKNSNLELQGGSKHSTIVYLAISTYLQAATTIALLRRFSIGKVRLTTGLGANAAQAGHCIGSLWTGKHSLSASSSDPVLPTGLEPPRTRINHHDFRPLGRRVGLRRRRISDGRRHFPPHRSPHLQRQQLPPQGHETDPAQPDE